MDCLLTWNVASGIYLLRSGNAYMLSKSYTALFAALMGQRKRKPSCGYTNYRYA